MFRLNCPYSWSYMLIELGTEHAQTLTRWLHSVSAAVHCGMPLAAQISVLLSKHDHAKALMFSRIGEASSLKCKHKQYNHWH